MSKDEMSPASPVTQAGHRRRCRHRRAAAGDIASTPAAIEEFADDHAEAARLQAHRRGHRPRSPDDAAILRIRGSSPEDEALFAEKLPYRNPPTRTKNC